MTSPLNLAIYTPFIRDGDPGAGGTAVTLDRAKSSFSLFAKGLSASFLEAKRLEEGFPFLTGPHLPLPLSDGKRIYLPVVFDAFSNRTDNWRALRILSAVQACEWRVGTFDRPASASARGNGSFAEGSPLAWVSHFLATFRIPALAADVFVVLESMRVAAASARDFKGLGNDIRWFLERLYCPAEPADHRLLLWNLFFSCFGFPGGHSALEHELLKAAFPLAGDNSSLKDTLIATVAIYGLLEAASGLPSLEKPAFAASTLKDPARAGIKAAGLKATADETGWQDPGDVLELDFVAFRVLAGAGDFLTEGKFGRKIDFESERARGDYQASPIRERSAGDMTEGAARFFYPEWDYKAALYRRDWVTLFESPAHKSASDKAGRLLSEREDLVREVSRQFRMLRFEDRAWRRRLEWGHELDIEQVANRVVETRCGLASDDKVYMEKRRLKREVSAIFLVDLSASTSSETDSGGGQTVLDLLVISIAIIARALDQLGDRYGIYGFSGYGRDRVEVLRVKSFGERLDEEAWGRIGGLEPMRSTRMGAAVRHCRRLLEAEPAQLKLLLLLSDGYPQDYDYGEDRTDREYGLRDTAQALLEAEAASVLPFCLTIDTAGNDYLRRLLPSYAYMVLKCVEDLPVQLPKVYMRLRAG
jgi:hypothetical protein